MISVWPNRRGLDVVHSTTALQGSHIGHAAVGHALQQRQAGTQLLPDVAHRAFVLLCGAEMVGKVGLVFLGLCRWKQPGCQPGVAMPRSQLVHCKVAESNLMPFAVLGL